MALVWKYIVCKSTTAYNNKHFCPLPVCHNIYGAAERRLLKGKMLSKIKFISIALCII